MSGAVTAEASPADAPPARVDHALVALAPSSVRARKRKGAIVLVWAYELCAGMVVAAPVHAWAKRAWGAHPDGDAVLFQPGGFHLLTWLGEKGAALPIVTQTSMLLLLVFAVMGQIVTGALVASLATGRGEAKSAPRWSEALGVGLASFLPLAGIGILATLAELVVLGLGHLASSGLDHALQGSYGDARGMTARLVVLALFVALALTLGVVADLARVTVARGIAIQEEARSSLGWMREGLRRAVATARLAIGKAMLAWGWRAAIALALIVVGGWAGDVAGARGGGALAALFVFHQAIVLARAGLRASWLANALRLTLVTAPPRPPSDGS